MKNLLKKQKTSYLSYRKVPQMQSSKAQKAGKMTSNSSYLILPELTCNSSYLKPY